MSEAINKIEYPAPILPVDKAGDTRANSPVLFGPVPLKLYLFNFIFKLLIIYLCKIGAG